MNAADAIPIPVPVPIPVALSRDVNNNENRDHQHQHQQHIRRISGSPHSLLLPIIVPQRDSNPKFEAEESRGRRRMNRFLPGRMIQIHSYSSEQEYTNTSFDSEEENNDDDDNGRVKFPSAFS